MAINVLDTTSISGNSSAYIVVKTGIIRVTATTATTLQIDGGPAIQIPAIEAGSTELYVGHPKKARLQAATDAAAMVVTVLNGGTPAHKFAVDDYVATINGGDSNFAAAFVSAASAGKKVTAISNTTITTDIDSSAATADYAVASAEIAGNTVPEIQRCVKLTTGSAGGVVVEQIQNFA
ncbi:hypothetical protein SWPG_00017 [Synechococcus phage S-CBM2]|nr:hypothetical protein SWPG_00017 [Synechococcus phage S-CBM2]